MKSLFKFLLICILLSLNGCKKCNPRRNICAEIEFLSTEDGSPISGMIFNFKYFKKGGFFGQYNNAEIGINSSYKNGIYYINHSYPSDSDGSGHLEASYPIVFATTYFDKFSVENSKKRQTIYIKPMYKLDLHFTNVNCQGITDTLNAYSETANYQVIGCDSLIYDELLPFIGPQYILGKNLHLSCVLIRNGVSETFSIDRVLEPDIKNHVYINY